MALEDCTPVLAILFVCAHRSSSGSKSSENTNRAVSEYSSQFKMLLVDVLSSPLPCFRLFYIDTQRDVSLVSSNMIIHYPRDAAAGCVCIQPFPYSLI